MNEISNYVYEYKLEEELPFYVDLQVSWDEYFFNSF